MKNNNLTVWTWPCAKRYYLLRPWKWFKELWWNIQNAHDRAHKGYCCVDWYNFDTWFKEVASTMLRDMAMHSHGYPGYKPFETPEKWASWLHRMADQLRECIDEEESNEYYKPYIDKLMESTKGILTGDETPEVKELRENYLKRSLELQAEHKKLFKETMDELIEHWDCLWD